MPISGRGFALLGQTKDSLSRVFHICPCQKWEEHTSWSMMNLALNLGKSGRPRSGDKVSKLWFVYLHNRADRLRASPPRILVGVDEALSMKHPAGRLPEQLARPSLPTGGGLSTHCCPWETMLPRWVKLIISKSALPLGKATVPTPSPLPELSFLTAGWNTPSDWDITTGSSINSN